MTTLQPAGRWRRSSRSAPQGDCVEIEGALRAVRDSKNPASELTFGASQAVASLVRSLRRVLVERTHETQK
ncbi:DUF397 domain-containing protein [Kibdelosporangium phytohabitans]|uniref:DUF397 domain-containing protein n=1 Tax=Kibdelosporangium phytohabitans TaxID=860235 RepID=UPI0009FB6B8C|nr:DUF397 domain-containing protein [Kibdelosporangium phytohabitans]MBE1468050.1 putative fused transcriptional regulator/phosphomethylpyrimidine kinase [Kibdelosporangium phytohabitans]